jgi:hypothetical protein
MSKEKNHHSKFLVHPARHREPLRRGGRVFDIQHAKVFYRKTPYHHDRPSVKLGDRHPINFCELYSASLQTRCNKIPKIVEYTGEKHFWSLNNL